MPINFRCGSHPRRRQQETGQQASSPDDLRLALSAQQELRRPGHSLSRAPAPLTHHRQVRHSQKNSSSGKTTNAILKSQHFDLALENRKMNIVIL